MIVDIINVTRYLGSYRIRQGGSGWKEQWALPAYAWFDCEAAAPRLLNDSNASTVSMGGPTVPGSGSPGFPDA